jgi:hypothetical protein
MKVLIKSALILGVGCCAVAWGTAQAPNSGGLSYDLTQEEPTLRVQSNLVLVPVFVYVHNGVEKRVQPDVYRCIDKDWQAFLATSATEPFFPAIASRPE